MEFWQISMNKTNSLLELWEPGLGALCSPAARHNWWTALWCSEFPIKFAWRPCFLGAAHSSWLWFFPEWEKLLWGAGWRTHQLSWLKLFGTARQPEPLPAQPAFSFLAFDGFSHLHSSLPPLSQSLCPLSNPISTPISQRTQTGHPSKLQPSVRMMEIIEN